MLPIFLFSEKEPSLPFTVLKVVIHGVSELPDSFWQPGERWKLFTAHLTAALQCNGNSEALLEPIGQAGSALQDIEQRKRGRKIE